MESISVIIPTLSRIVLLEEAINSVLSQTIKPAEIIVVDADKNGSAQEIVNKIAKKYSVLRYVKGDGGASRNRNIGAEAATSHVFAFLDDDDLWKPTYLEKALSKLKEQNSSAIVTWLNSYDGKNITSDKHISSDLPINAFFEKNPGVTGSNILIRSDIFNKLGGYDETLLVSEDKDLLMQIIDADYIYNIVEEPLVLRRTHNMGNLSDSSTYRFLEGIQNFYPKYKKKMSYGTRRRFLGKIDWSAYQCKSRFVEKLWLFIRLILRGNIFYIIKLIKIRYYSI